MSRDEFWASTPREVFNDFTAARRRDDDAHDAHVLLAWRIVSIWAHTKTKGRMPSLRPLLRETQRERRPPTHAQQRAVLDVLSAQYGIPLHRVTLTH